MSQKSVSTKRSLRSLFSKSEANLSVEKDDSGKGKTFRFIKWKKKKKSESTTDRSEENLTAARTEPATPGVNEGQDGEEWSGHKSSPFGTVPRSKKGLLSYSETDLRKPMRFGTFTLGWRKKKREGDLSQSLASIREIPGVKVQNSKEDVFKSQAEVEQTSLNQQDGFEVTEAAHVAIAPPHIISNQCQSEYNLSDMPFPNKEDRQEDAALDAVAFMPANLDHSSIPYIDSSVSDSEGYQTPPESPGPGSLASYGTAAQGSLIRQSPTPAETCRTEPSSTISRCQIRFAQMGDPKPLIITDTEFFTRCKDGTSSYPDIMHGEAEYSSTANARPPSPPAVSFDRSTQYSSSMLPCISLASRTDSISPAPNMETEANIETHFVDLDSYTEAHMKLNGVSGKDDHPHYNFETSESGISADFEVDLDKESKDGFTTIPQSSYTSNPQSSTSDTLESFTSDKTISQSSISNSVSVFTHPELSPSHQTYNITTEAEDSQKDNRDMSVTNNDILLTMQPSSVSTNTCKPMSVSSEIPMPDVIVSSTLSSSQNIENNLDADSDPKPISSFSKTDVLVAKTDLTSIYNVLSDSLVPQNFPIFITVHTNSESTSLEETHPSLNGETISKESHQTNNYIYSKCSTDSEKPNPAVAGPVHCDPQPAFLEDESNISLARSVPSSVHTIISSTVEAPTFDLSRSTDLVNRDPDRSWGSLSNNETYSDVVTPSNISNYVSQEIDQAKSVNSPEIFHTSSDFPDCVTSRSSPLKIPTILIHPPLQTDISDLLSSPLAPKAEFDKQLGTNNAYEGFEKDQPTVTSVTWVNAEETPTLERPNGHWDLIGRGETSAESVTTESDLNMFVKENYGPEEEEQNVDNENYNVTSTKEKEMTSEQSLVGVKDMEVASQKQRLLQKGAEENTEGQQIVQSTREASKMQDALELEAKVCGDIDVLTGEAKQQIYCVAPLKPALLVNQECAPEECDSAPPSTEPVKVPLANSSMLTHSHLDTGLHPLNLQQSTGEKTLLADTTESKYQTYPDNHHVQREGLVHSESGEDTRTESSQNQDLTSLELTKQSTLDTGKISTFIHNREKTLKHTQDACNKEGEVTGTKVKTSSECTDTISSFTLKNVVQISETTSEDRRKEEDLHTAEVNTFPDHLFGTSLIPGDRFFHASTVLSTVIEEPETESQAETEPGSDLDMSSGIGVLSTTLAPRSSSTRAGREDVKVRKVSLVKIDNRSSSENHERPKDTIGLKDQSDQSKVSPELRRRWETLHSSSEEKKSDFKENSDYKLTESTYLHSSKSPSYDKVVYTSHFSSPGAQKQTQPTATVSETDGSPGNSSRNLLESEVQVSRESYTSGRSRVELSTPVREKEGERELEIRKTGFDSEARLDSSPMTAEVDDSFSGVFRATRVELLPSPTTPEPDVLSPSSLHAEMDSFVDTLKSMERPVRQRVQRASSNTPFSSLPPIEEDAPASPRIPISPITEPKKVSNGISSLPPDIGLNWSSPKDMRSPLTMMKEQKSAENPSRGLTLPLRASAMNSIVIRKGSHDLSPDETPTTGLANGSSLLSPSRLENSLFFQPTENGKTSNRSIYRAASLPEISPSHDRMSSAPKASDALLASRFDRFSFLTSSSSSLSGIIESSRISTPPSIQPISATDPPSFNHKSTLELYRSLPSETLLKNTPPLSLARSSSLETGLHLNDNKSFQVNKKPEPERNLTLKYRAFPDAYLTKEKEHGKLNPRPGKMFIYDMPGFRGQRIEVRGDVVDATPWEFADTISVRVIRGGWVFYEKPDFKGEKIALDEGEVELTNPFGPPEEDQVKLQNGTAQENGEKDENPKPQRKKNFVIGSIRRAVRDYSVPEICLFPEENAEGKKVTFRDTSEDARIFGFPVKANSIIINAGLWLVFAEPFFQGVPRVLEVGGFPTPAAWGVTQPYISSVHPLKIGEPRVENLYEPKIVIYEKPYFTGKSREIYTSMRDFMTRVDRQQSAFMFSPGSIQVVGGCWAGYEKEGFRGHQYLLEEGDYHDWRVWGGVNAELRSVRVIQADLSEPMLVLIGMNEQEKETDEEHTFEVTEAVPDVELFSFRTNTRSIHVLSGAWVAYSHVDFSGNQYILEKGFYNNCADWGSGDNRICSLQPILPGPSEGPSFRNEVLLYSEPNFQGTCRVCHQNQGRLPENLIVKSCRVVGGSWVLYEDEMFKGDQYILPEGNYPSLTSMGCRISCCVRSVKPVPITFSLPSVSLFGLECFEGREVNVENQIANMLEEGFNTQFLSVRVNSGCWVLCEHSNYRGRQFLLEPIEITNWHKFSSLTSIGSLYPIRQKQRFFRIRNKDTGHYMSVQGGVEDMKTGRVVVSEQVDGLSDVWLYQDGLIKNKLARTMSLQVMGNVESGAKVVLWTETRVPVQTWNAKVSGTISSINFSRMVLDIKGGKTYDKHHLVIREENEEKTSQQWELEFV